MRAELKELLITDIDVSSFWPEVEDDFGFYIQAIIGVEGEDGGDSFGFQICTPKWLISNHDTFDAIFPRNMIIVFEYDIENIKKKIAARCEKCFGRNWLEIANELSKIGSWEFENYAPHS